MWEYAVTRGVNALLDYASTNKEAKFKEKLQQYNNMQKILAGAHQVAVVERNKAEALDASLGQKLEIERNALQAQGRLDVQAAASGARGGSVAAVARDISRNAARANFNREEDLLLQQAQADEQIVGIQADVERSLTHNVFNKQNLLAAALNVGTDVYKKGVEIGKFGMPVDPGEE